MVEKNSRTWGDSGTEPAAGEEVIPGGEEYPADWMNWAMWAMTTDIDALVDVVGSLEAVNGVTEVRYETLANRPAAGTAGRFSILSDEQRVTIDDGNEWQTVGAHSHDDLADVSEGDHRTAEQVRDLAGGMAGTALEHDDAGDALNVVQEDVEDWVGSLLSGEGNISVTYNDANDALLVDTSALNEEEVEDAVSGLLSAGDNLSWNYDDGNDVLTVSLSGPITGVQIGEDGNRVDAYLGSADVESLSAGSSFTDPAGNTYTGAIQKSDEQVRDLAGGMMSEGLSYDDANDLISVLLADGLTLDGNGKIRVASESVTTGMLSFDIVTQTELNSHSTDANNPHDVTDDQTGAANALSTHAGDRDAHHGPPAGTTVLTRDNSEGFYTNSSARMEFVHIVVSDGGNGPVFELYVDGELAQGVDLEPGSTGSMFAAVPGDTNYEIVNNTNNGLGDVDSHVVVRV